MTRWIRFGTLIVSGLCILLITSFVARTRARAEAGVAILDVDTDRRIGAIDRNIYGHFLEQPNKITAVERMVPYARVLTIDLAPYTVAVVEIAAK